MYNIQLTMQQQCERRAIVVVKRSHHVDQGYGLHAATRYVAKTDLVDALQIFLSWSTLYTSNGIIYFSFFFSGKINSDVKSRFLQFFVTIFWLLVSSLRMILFNDQFIQILIPIFFLIVKWFVKTQLFSTFSIFILLFMIERENILIALKH